MLLAFLFVKGLRGERMAVGVDDERDACHDEGDAKQLPHIDTVAGDHIDFPSLLHVLDALDEEAEAEDARQEVAEDEARVAASSVTHPVEIHTQGEDEEVSQRFVDLCRVAGGDRHTALSVASELRGAREDEAPRRVGRAAEDLAIHQVPHTNECRSQPRGDSQTVECPEDGLLRHTARVDPYGEDDPDGPPRGSPSHLPTP